jgi:hypothetical protein
MIDSEALLVAHHQPSPPFRVVYHLCPHPWHFNPHHWDSNVISLQPRPSHPAQIEWQINQQNSFSYQSLIEESGHTLRNLAVQPSNNDGRRLTRNAMLVPGKKPTSNAEHKRFAMFSENASQRYPRSLWEHVCDVMCCLTCLGIMRAQFATKSLCR